MRHRNTTKTLGRNAAQRKALLRDLSTSLVVYEKIKTTTAKAKALRPVIERLITTARKGDLASRRRLYAFFSTTQPVDKLMDVIGPRYKGRAGGYTRIVKLGHRQGDGADISQIELV